MIDNLGNQSNQPYGASIQFDQVKTPKTNRLRPKKIKGTIPDVLRNYISMDNIAKEVSRSKLSQIAINVIEGMQKDKDSRKEWEDIMEEAMKIVKQIFDIETFPWPGSANIKYPLVLGSIIQIVARSYPQIVQGNKVVHTDVMSMEPTEDEENKADDIANYMSYQLLEEIPNWKDDTAKLIAIWALNGIAFRKGYYDKVEKSPGISLCTPETVIINNNVASLAEARRITHIIEMSANDIVSNMRAGIFVKYDLDKLQDGDTEEKGDADNSKKTHIVLEQHTWLDLDDDGYEEPYIITVHKKSQLVLRICARYDEDSFYFTEGIKDFIKIKPHQYFSDYHFFPSPDGAYHSLGFGLLLYPLNAAINTGINQLLDSATLSNMPCGLIAEDLRIRKENFSLMPGEWMKVQVPYGSSISNNIFPIPAKEPSGALLNLMQFLLAGAEKIAAITDIMQGQSPGANTPATTVVAMVEQGTKVYSFMFSNLYNGLKKEFNILFDLNKRFFSEEKYFKNSIKGAIIKPIDFKDDYGIYPVADPSMASDMLNLSKAQALYSLKDDPNVDPYEITKRFLKALKVPNIDSLLKSDDELQQQQEEQAAMAQQQQQIAQQEQQNAQNVSEAEAFLNKMKGYGVLVDNEVKLVNLERQIASDGGKMAADKIDSIANLTIAQAKAGESITNKAAKEASIIQQQTMQQQIPLENRIQALEQMFMQLYDQYQQPQQQIEPQEEQASMPEQIQQSSPAEGEQIPQVSSGQQMTPEQQSEIETQLVQSPSPKSVQEASQLEE